MKYILILVLLISSTASAQELRKSANNRIASRVLTSASAYLFIKAARIQSLGNDPEALNMLAYFFALCAAATDGASIYYLWKADKK